MAHIPEIEYEDIKVKLVSELPEFLQDTPINEKEIERNKRCHYKQLQEEFRDCP